MTIALNQPGLVTNASKYLQFEGDFTGSAAADTDGLVKVAVTISDAAKTRILSETKTDIDALKAEGQVTEQRITTLEANQVKSIIDGRVRGLVGDGSTDNTALLQSLIDEASQSGAIITLPNAGAYICKNRLFARDHVRLDLGPGTTILKDFSETSDGLSGLGLITNETAARLKSFCITGQGVLAQTPTGAGKLLTLFGDDMLLQCGMGERRLRPGTGDGWGVLTGGDRLRVDMWGTADPDTSNGHGGLDGLHIIGGEGMRIDLQNLRSGDDTLALVPPANFYFTEWTNLSIRGVQAFLRNCISTHARIAVAGIVANSLGQANTTSIVEDIDVWATGGTGTRDQDGASEVSGFGVIGNAENFARDQIRRIRMNGRLVTNSPKRAVNLDSARHVEIDVELENAVRDVLRVTNTEDCRVRLKADLSGIVDDNASMLLPFGSNTRLGLDLDLVAPDAASPAGVLLPLGIADLNPMADCETKMRVREVKTGSTGIRVGAHYTGTVALNASKADGATGTVGFNLDPAANAVITADSDLSLVDTPLFAPDSADAGGNIIARGIKGLSGLVRTSPALANAEVWGLHSVNMTGCAASVLFLPGSATIVELQVSMDRGGTWRSIGPDTRLFELPPYAWVRSLHSGGTVSFRATVL